MCWIRHWMPSGCQQEWDSWRYPLAGSPVHFLVKKTKGMTLNFGLYKHVQMMGLSIYGFTIELLPQCLLPLHQSEGYTLIFLGSVKYQKRNGMSQTKRSLKKPVWMTKHSKLHYHNKTSVPFPYHHSWYCLYAQRLMKNSKEVNILPIYWKIRISSQGKKVCKEKLIGSIKATWKGPQTAIDPYKPGGRHGDTSKHERTHPASVYHWCESRNHCPTWRKR